VSITFDGGTLPSPTDGNELSLELIDESTGYSVLLNGPQWSQSGPNFDQWSLMPGTDHFTQTLLPGSYSAIYSRGDTTDFGGVVYATPTTEALPYGHHLLGQCLAVGP
jgi:hypothetical protein